MTVPRRQGGQRHLCSKVYSPQHSPAMMADFVCFSSSLLVDKSFFLVTSTNGEDEKPTTSDAIGGLFWREQTFVYRSLEPLCLIGPYNYLRTLFEKVHNYLHILNCRFASYINKILIKIIILFISLYTPLRKIFDTNVIS